MNFYIDKDTRRVHAEGTDLVLWIDTFREGSILMIEDGEGNPVDQFYCSSSKRKLGWLARRRLPDSFCPFVVIWTVGCHHPKEALSAKAGIPAKDFIQRFFEFFKGWNGVGCYIDERPKDALVEVIFGD